MAKNSNYSILVDAEFNTNQIQQQLAALKIPSKEFETMASGVQRAKSSTDELALSVDAANKVFQATKEVISSFVEQVYEMDGAITEFKKVSDLQGESLDKYVSKLSKMGQSVVRTGKPNRYEPGRWDSKPAPRTAPKPLKALRALQLQYRMRYVYMNVGNYYNCKDGIWTKVLSTVKKGSLGAKS